MVSSQKSLTNSKVISGLKISRTFVSRDKKGVSIWKKLIWPDNDHWSVVSGHKNSPFHNLLGIPYCCPELFSVSYYWRKLLRCLNINTSPAYYLKNSAFVFFCVFKSLEALKTEGLKIQKCVKLKSSDSHQWTIS